MPTDSNHRTILMAEDDPFISRMYDLKLTGAGYRVIIKNNGREAYESFKTEHPDLLLLDLNMPELSGLEVLAALKSDGVDFNKLPVVVLTNSSRDEDREAADTYHAEYLVKAELTPKQVLEMIDSKFKVAKSA